MKRQYLYAIAFLVLVFLVSWFLVQKGQNYLKTKSNNTPPVVTTSTPATPEKPIVDSKCKAVNGLPDPVCTPGVANPDVTQENIKATICVSGYTKTIRPSTSYTNKLEVQQMQEYGLSGSLADYEEDHLIPLEVGGHPTDPKNLFPEAYYPYPGAIHKDKVENYLHDQVCTGKMNLVDAQKAIATDWLEVYKTLPNN